MIAIPCHRNRAADEVPTVMLLPSSAIARRARWSHRLAVGSVEVAGAGGMQREQPGEQRQIEGRQQQERRTVATPDRFDSSR